MDTYSALRHTAIGGIRAGAHWATCSLECLEAFAVWTEDFAHNTTSDEWGSEHDGCIHCVSCGRIVRYNPDGCPQHGGSDEEMPACPDVDPTATTSFIQAVRFLTYASGASHLSPQVLDALALEARMRPQDGWRQWAFTLWVVRDHWV